MCFLPERVHGDLPHSHQLTPDKHVHHLLEAHRVALGGGDGVAAGEPPVAVHDEGHVRGDAAATRSISDAFICISLKYRIFTPINSTRSKAFDFQKHLKAYTRATNK